MKIISVKLNYNPTELYYNDNILDYIYKLENENRLSDLPDSLLVFHTLSCLYDEIMNGGFAQYLYNQYDCTFKYLDFCVQKISHQALKDIICEYLDVCKRATIVDKAIASDSDVQKIERLDDKFVMLDEKEDLKKVFRKTYREILSQSSPFFNVEIDEDSDRQKFFLWDKKGVTIENALDSFLRFLASHEQMKWVITVKEFFSTFTIHAKSKENIDSNQVMKTWVNATDFHNALLFKCVIIRNLFDDFNEVIDINKSGYEKNEFVIQKWRNNGKYLLEKEYSTTVMLGASNPSLQLDVKKFKLKEVIAYLQSSCKNYGNISFSQSNGVSMDLYNDLINAMENAINEEND